MATPTAESIDKVFRNKLYQRFSQLRDAFRALDKDANGMIDVKDFAEALKNLGYIRITRNMVESLAAKYDKNGGAHARPPHQSPVAQLAHLPHPAPVSFTQVRRLVLRSLCSGSLTRARPAYRPCPLPRSRADGLVSYAEFVATIEGTPMTQAEGKRVVVSRADRVEESFRQQVLAHCTSLQQVRAECASRGTEGDEMCPARRARAPL
jgi:hypothetical protein